MNDLASEFFFGAVARIPPGLLIVVLYWRTETENIFHAHRDFFSSPLLFIICVLVTAWFLGVMVDAVIFVPSAYFFSRLGCYPGPAPIPDSNDKHKVLGRKKCTPLAYIKSWLRAYIRPVPIPDPKDQDEDCRRVKRRFAYFLMAEATMSRCLYCIFLVSCFYPPERFSNIHWTWYYSLSGFLAFLLLSILVKGLPLIDAHAKPEDTRR
jgi:hypothetical protein